MLDDFALHTVARTREEALAMVQKVSFTAPFTGRSDATFTPKYVINTSPYTVKFNYKQEITLLDKYARSI
jgi:hypothetical protein